MKKNYIILIILIVIIIIGLLFFFFSNKNNSTKNNTTENYQSEKTLATQNNSGKNVIPDNTANIIIDTNNSPENNVTIQQPTSPVETEISSFSTKIHNKDTERQNNITITCSTLNNTEVTSGSTFSFCNVIGKSTSDKGYQEADVFTSDGEVTKGLGGGNCQVSTTLYNAVLAIPELQVTERHEHSGYVPYIKEGKDAAVAYGSYDFKFINNLPNTIKIVAQNSADSITIKILKLT